jgi:hypothetical protein
MEPDMETQELFKIGGRKICSSFTVGLVMQHIVIRPTQARSDKGNKLFNDVISTAENIGANE